MYTANWLELIRNTLKSSDPKKEEKIEELLDRAQEDRDTLLKMADQTNLINTLRYMLAHETVQTGREQLYSSKLENILKKHKIEIPK